MERAIPLGRLAGVPLAMSWVVPPVALLYAWALAYGVLPTRVPHQSDAAYWSAAAAGAVLFFLSLLAHEMGHALVGRWEGVGVRRVTLTLLGGYTRFDTEPDRPSTELKVSAIGPLVNLVLAGGFWVTTQVLWDLQIGGDGAVWAEALRGLAFVNLILAVANMLPGAPLDGGAVLGALVWMATDDRHRADNIVGVLGVALGVATTAAGILFFVDGSPYGPWALIGGVVVTVSAVQRLRAAPTLGRLRGTTIGSVMAASPPEITESTLLIDVVTNADAWQPHTAFPVRSADGELTGLLTAELVMAVEPMQWTRVTAGEVAWPAARLATARAEEPVLTAMQRADSSGFDRLLVLGADGAVAGVAGREALSAALTG